MFYSPLSFYSVLSVGKMMSRIVAPSDILQKADKLVDVKESLHDHTYGITSDPLTQFACAFSALIHDVSGAKLCRFLEERN